MKKKLTLIALLAALGAAPASALAQEATMVGIIGGADGSTAVYVTDNEANENYAAIYYNSEYITPGTIIDDRTVLPFRDFLEAIGAEVEYNEENETVRAVRGNSVVSFSINSDIIHIKNDEGEKDIIMDVKPAVLDGTVYMPVRFLGEAFAMQIGWSEYNRTVLIADYEKYTEEFLESSPNFKRLTELNTDMPDKYFSGADAVLNFKTSFPEFDDDFNVIGSSESVLDFAMKAEGTAQGLNQNSESVISLSYKGADGTEVTLEDANLSLVSYDNVFYIKTDILEQLAETNEELQSTAKLYSADEWYKLSLEDYINIISSAVGGEAIDIEYIQELIDNASDPFAMLDMQMRNITLYDTSSVDGVTMVFNVIAALDKYINIEELGDKNYSVGFSFDENDLLTLIADISGEEIPEEDLEELKDSIIFELNVEQKTENGIAVAQNVSLNIEFADDYDSFKMSLNTAAVPDEDAEDVKAPEDYVDLSEILGILFEGE